MSIDGYDKLLKDLNASFHGLNQLVKDEFELQQENALSVDIMSEYNIKPLDILYLLPNSSLLEFCNVCTIKSRGNIRQNILSNYKDIENLYLENYVLIGKRDINALIENGLNIKESELGLKYEELTKKIFSDLGYYVDDKLKKKINTNKGQMDILLNLGNNELFVVECKTIKDKDYNKYSTVSRQLRSYENQCEKNGYRVLQLLLVSNDFSEDFIAECDCDYEMNLSLLSSEGLLKIMNGFKQSKLDSLPNKLFLKGGKLDEDRIVKALIHR